VKKFLTIAMIATVLIGSGFTSAYAAEKVLNLRDNDEIFVGVEGPLCGSDDVVITLESNAFIKLWTNDHFKVHISSQFNLYDLVTGVLVGTAPNEAINIQGNLSNLPISGNFNAGGDGTCVDGTTFPALASFHCGNTLQKSGELIAHSISCL